MFVNMKWINLFLLMLPLTVTGCGTAWVIDQGPWGGRIGYKGYQSSEKANAAIMKLIHCPNYTPVNDGLRSQQATMMTPVTTTSNTTGQITNAYGNPIANYSGEQTQTQYVPTTYNKQWREFTYKCEESALASTNETSCEDGCKDMEKKKQFKPGMDLASCIKKLCN